MANRAAPSRNRRQDSHWLSAWPLPVPVAIWFWVRSSWPRTRRVCSCTRAVWVHTWIRVLQNTDSILGISSVRFTIWGCFCFDDLGRNVIKAGVKQGRTASSYLNHVHSPNLYTSCAVYTSTSPRRSTSHGPSPDNMHSLHALFITCTINHTSLHAGHFPRALYTLCAPSQRRGYPLIVTCTLSRSRAPCPSLTF